MSLGICDDVYNYVVKLPCASLLSVAGNTQFYVLLYKPCVICSSIRLNGIKEDSVMWNSTVLLLAVIASIHILGCAGVRHLLNEGTTFLFLCEMSKLIFRSHQLNKQSHKTI